jgi:hypothetical protein
MRSSFSAFEQLSSFRDQYGTPGTVIINPCRRTSLDREKKLLKKISKPEKKGHNPVFCVFEKK